MTCPIAPCSRFRRPGPFISIFALGAFVTLIGLGTWQLQRLEWKENLIARIEAAKKAPPVALPTDEAELKSLEFHPVAIEGHFLKDIEFHVTPRYFRDKLGYHLFTPFKLDDGRIVLVNRGWVPTELKDPKTRRETLPSTKEQRIVGMVRLPGDRTYFTPPSSPEKNIWFSRDITQMAESKGLKNVAPVGVDVLGEQDPKVLPVPSDGEIHLLNDHLQYAITWFAIAAALVVIFLVYHHKGKDEV